MNLENRTPFHLDRLVVLDKEGAEHLVVIAKATFTIGPAGALTPTRPQPPLQLADEFHGEPGISSIRRASEATPPKPGTDVHLFGFARAREPETRVVDVRLRVGPIDKSVRVTGPRRWRRFLWWWWATKPEPFGKIALTWENAYGGTDTSPANKKHHAWEPRNPVGRGFAANGSTIPWSEQVLPFIEDPRYPLKRPGLGGTPTGLGPIARHWQPRVGYAGTYDDTWMKERMPLLPRDFDDRFHSAAPPDLFVREGLKGHERVDILGCTKHEERLSFRLPGVRFAARVRLRTRWEEPEMKLDTVEIDVEARELVLLSRAMVRVHGEVPEIREISLEATDAEGAPLLPIPETQDAPTADRESPVSQRPAEPSRV